MVPMLPPMGPQGPLTAPQIPSMGVGTMQGLETPEIAPESLLDDFMESLRESPDWTSLNIDRKHMDERVVELLLEQYEADLETLVDFIDVRGRPAFHLLPLKDELAAWWQDETMRQKMISDAMATGGPKAVSELIDQMDKNQERYWSRMLTAPGAMPVEEG